MIDRQRTMGILTLGAILLAYGGCTQSPSRVHPPGINARAAGEAAMQQYDTNKDGKVSGEELQKAPSLSAAIGNLDKDRDQAVTAQEVTERIEAWQASKVGQMMEMIKVKYRGQPLAGANIVFEPEIFLGTEMKMAGGTTDKSGMVMQGIAPGLYKVRITKEGVNLPAKYNTQTTLGAEVAKDAKLNEGCIFFDLK